MADVTCKVPVNDPTATCEDCPLYYEVFGSVVTRCTADKLLRDISDLVIPDWCPLRAGRVILEADNG